MSEKSELTRETGGMTRRDVLRVGATAAGAGLLGAGALLPCPAGAEYGRAAHTYGIAPEPEPTTRKRVQANDKIVLALIGSGGQGRSDMRGLMSKPGVEIAAVCDPDAKHAAAGAQDVEGRTGKRPKEVKDFRQVLEMKDVNAVIIGTPDHWHALPMIMACQAGKDSLVEKPISHNIVEGQ